MNRVAWPPLLMTAFGMLATAAASAAEVTVYSRTYVREAGQPEQWAEQVTIPPNAGQPFVLRVTNGLPDGSRRVSSAWIRMAGVEIIGQADLNQNVERLQRPVAVDSGSVSLQVRLASNPGGQLAVELIGTALRSGPAPPAEVLAGALLRGDAGLGVAGVRWAPSPSPEIARYRVYRGASSNSLAPVSDVPAQEIQDGYYYYRDETYQLETVVFYAVSAIDGQGVEGPPTAPYAVLAGDFNDYPRFPKLNSALVELYLLWEAGSDIVPLARDRGVGLDRTPPQAVSVWIHMANGNPIPPDDVAAVRQLGARQLLISDDMIEALVPVEALPAMIALPIVKSMSPTPQGHVNQTASAPSPPAGFAVLGNLSSIEKLIGFNWMHRSHARGCMIGAKPDSGCKGEGISVALLDQGKATGHALVSRDIIYTGAPNILPINAYDSVPDDPDPAVPYAKFLGDLSCALGEPLDPTDPNQGGCESLSFNDVINVSLGFGPWGQLTEEVEKRLRRHPKVILVAAAGNEGESHYSATMTNLVDSGAGWADLRSADSIAIDRTASKYVPIYVYSPDARRSQRAIQGCENLKLKARICLENTEECFPLRLEEAEFLSWLRWAPWVRTESLRVQIEMGPKYVDASGQEAYCNEGREVHILAISGTAERVTIPGNDPTGCISGLAAAPSAVVVGASVADRPSEGGFDFTESYGCQGPAVVPAKIDGQWSFEPSDKQKPDLMAPGKYRGQESESDGTSNSAPWVTAAAVLLMQQYRSNNLVGGQPRQVGSVEEAEFVLHQLRDLAIPLRGKRTGTPEWRPAFGYGRANLRRAGTWVTTGNRLYRFTPEGEAEPVPYTESSIIFDLSAEIGGTGAAWFIDAVANEVVRIEPDGRKAAYQPIPEGFVYALAYSPAEQGAWAAVDPLHASGFDSQLVKLQHAPDLSGQTGGDGSACRT